MKILAIETASDACSAALNVDGEIIERFEVAPRQHTTLLLPMVESVLAEGGVVLSQLDAMAVGRGPGAFTGVRIAVAAAQGLAFAAELPVASISSLEVMAYQAHREEEANRVLVAVDARMGEVYWGGYEIDGSYPQLVGQEQVSKPENLPAVEGEWFAIGSGWDEYSAAMDAHYSNQVKKSEQAYYPKASSVAQLAVGRVERGELLAAEQVLPTYLRDKVV